MLDRIIYYSFGLLFFLVPFIWTSKNFELFEYNKMISVYLLTIVITSAWLLKIINQKSFIINRTPLAIPLLLFLGANILSTIFSIDQHTSIWGYYSRSNGGLLSTISYLLLFFAFVSNISKEKAIKILKLAVISGAIISIYGILEHFGMSFSCLILRGEANVDCWIQDVQSRVFATLGQPNWLAAYLAMLIFPSIYFVLNSTKRSTTIIYSACSVLIYLAFTFTYSRGGMLGFLAGLGVFAGLLIFLISRSQKNVIPDLIRDPVAIFLDSRFRGNDKSGFSIIRKVLLIIVIFLIVNILFGSALTRFQLSSLFQTQSQPVTEKVQLNQLENGGTESGTIRLIVWRGALDIFKAYPLFGSGVETFAYSYYQFRPAEHNLVSEWDFLYNKAHNEYLNYLATTGIVGFITYILVIISFIVFCIKYLVLSKTKIPDTQYSILLVSLLASYISYLVQNFFSFSVVIIAVFFYLFPAIAFVSTDSIKPMTLFKIPNFFFKHNIYIRLTQVLIIVVTAHLLLSVIKIWYGDTLFARGYRFNESDQPGQAYRYLELAVQVNKNEPLYQSEMAQAAASSALALAEDDATTSAELRKEAIDLTYKVLTENPKNTSYHRTSIRTYFALSGIEKSYTLDTLNAIDRTIELAPTDAKLYYNKSVVLGQAERTDEALEALQKAIELKPNYRDAYYAQALYFHDKKELDKAKESLGHVLELVPGDPEASEKLKEWNLNTK